MVLGPDGIEPYAVREDLERYNTLRMAGWETDKAEFLLSMGKFKDAEECFDKSRILLTILHKSDLPIKADPKKKFSLVGGEFVKAFQV